MSMTSGNFQQPHSLGQAIEKLRSRWPWFVGYGALCVAFGVLALTMVAASTLAVVFFVALMLIVAGGAEIILGFNSRDWPSFFLWVISGLFYLVFGAFALARPEVAAAVLTAFVGFGFLFAGIARIWLGFQPAGRPESLCHPRGRRDDLAGRDDFGRLAGKHHADPRESCLASICCFTAQAGSRWD